MELNENELEGIVGGLPYEDAVQKQKDFFEKTASNKQQELSENELEGIIGGLPYERAVEEQKDFFNKQTQSDELTHEQLESVMASRNITPEMLEEESGLRR